MFVLFICKALNMYMYIEGNICNYNDYRYGCYGNLTPEHAKLKLDVNISKYSLTITNSHHQTNIVPISPI